MDKLLFISNITNKIGAFSYASVLASKKCNLEFHMASNWSNVKPSQIKKEEEKYGIKIHNINLSRSPYNIIRNYKAYKKIVSIVKNEDIKYIHCNTPIGGILGRLIGKKCEINSVIYQAHGFHFYKGAPIKNWILYYPVEKLLAHWTDVIITINKEDYNRAQEFKLRDNGQVYYVPGVGIDVSSYQENNKESLSKEKLGIKKDDFVIISVGELNNNKNNKVILKALSKIRNEKIHYFICGIGGEENNLRLLSKKLKIDKQVHFLGYRKDIKDLYKIVDLFVLPSYREGLSRSLMEAMASGLPCVVSKIRGNVDLIEEGKGGYLRESDDADGFSDSIRVLYEDINLRKSMSKFNQEKIKEYDVEVVIKQIEEIYKHILYA